VLLQRAPITVPHQHRRRNARGASAASAWGVEERDRPGRREVVFGQISKVV